MSEGLRRWTRNLSGSARRGLNPLAVARLASNVASILLDDLRSGSYALDRAGKKCISGARHFAFHGISRRDLIMLLQTFTVGQDRSGDLQVSRLR